MSHYGNIPAGAQEVERLVHMEWRIKIAGFHQHMHSLFSDGEQVVVADALGQHGTYHVFGSQMQHYRSSVGGTQLTKALLQLGGGVGVVLHDMRSEPHLGDAQLLVGFQHGLGIAPRLTAVIHSVEQMAVVIGIAMEKLTLL